MSDAVKHDSGKPRLGLISSKFLFGLGQVLTFGARKYDPFNWRKGLEYSRIYDALQRHLVAWNGGESIDPESGLSHLKHAAANLMFLVELEETRPDLDDRFKGDK